VTNQLWWYVARAGGIVAWILLAASVVLGLFLSTRLRPLNAPPVWTTDLHRFLGGLATIFVGVHVAAIILDSYTSFGVADVLVPFASSWHPLWVAWGIVSMYLLLAVELTSLARARLPRKLWHAVHLLSLPLFAFSTVHFAGAGTDAGNPLAVFGMILLSGVVVGFLFRRFGRSPSPTPTRGRRPVRQGVERRSGAGEVEHLGEVARVPVPHAELP
jgi:methionine sulfoxide reductase heme-binding subunit